MIGLYGYGHVPGQPSAGDPRVLAGIIPPGDPIATAPTARSAVMPGNLARLRVAPGYGAPIGPSKANESMERRSPCASPRNSHAHGPDQRVTPWDTYSIRLAARSTPRVTSRSARSSRRADDRDGHRADTATRASSEPPGHYARTVPDAAYPGLLTPRSASATWRSR